MATWDWMLRVYARPGAPEACLRLQDDHGQNTSYLLWAIYAGVDDQDLLAKAAAVARAWDDSALIRLREVRRALKLPAPPIGDGPREALREQVKALELSAERLLIETLDAMTQIRGTATPIAALAAASKAWGVEAPAAALADLAAIFE